MTPPHHLSATFQLLHQLRFIAAIEAQRYLIFVVLGFIGWGWWRRRAGTNSRLQPGPIDRAQLAREALYPTTTIVVFTLVSIGILAVAGKSQRLFYANVSDYGWVYLIVSVPIMMVIQDTYFYWTHRLMHHRALFRFFHRTHHLSTNPTPLTTYSINPLEALVDSGAVVLIVFFLPKHIAAYLVFSYVNTAYAVYAHLGHEIVPASWATHRFGRWVNTSVAHNIHHARARYNFSWYFLFWDRLMGTVDPDYEAQMRARAVATRGRRIEPSVYPITK
jgi:sterol desaturase/sphingolipid hydroxylase (fatty acid hydroxylase superfamily)